MTFGHLVIALTCTSTCQLNTPVRSYRSLWEVKQNFPSTLRAHISPNLYMRLLAKKLFQMSVSFHFLRHVLRQRQDKPTMRLPMLEHLACQGTTYHYFKYVATSLGLPHTVESSYIVIPVTRLQPTGFSNTVLMWPLPLLLSRARCRRHPNQHTSSVFICSCLWIGFPIRSCQSSPIQLSFRR